MGIKKPASGAGAWVSGAKLNSGVSASLDTRIVLPANGTWLSSFDYTYVLTHSKTYIKLFFARLYFRILVPRSTRDFNHSVQLHRKRLSGGGDLLLDAEHEVQKR